MIQINEDILSKLIARINNGEQGILAKAREHYDLTPEHILIMEAAEKAARKLFKMVSGAQLIFWNIDSLKLANQTVITEGEIDALTIIECGIKEAVSVPNGANKGTNNLQYLDDCINDFDGIEKIIVAVDNDAPGLSLREELVRRLGPERCYIPDFKDCKDANEYGLKYGLLDLHDCIKNAKPVPIEGIMQASDMAEEMMSIYLNGLPTGESLNLPHNQQSDDNLDDLLKWMPGQLTMITGSPGSGKSELLDHICERLAVYHDWKFGVFSPENFPSELHLVKLAEKLIGRPFQGHYRMDESDIKLAMSFIEDHWHFIRPKDENYSLDIILEKARILVVKYGIKGLIIDPWNYLEHQMGNVSETNYVSQQLAKIVSFKQRYKVAVFIVAHPRKLQKDKTTGQYEAATLYDIIGSSHFFNKTDNGISVSRDFESGLVTSFIQKVKFKWMGRVGKCIWAYDSDSGRYQPVGVPFDKNPHLGTKKNIEVKEKEPFRITPNLNAEKTLPIEDYGVKPIYMCSECMIEEVMFEGGLCDRCG